MFWFFRNKIERSVRNPEILQSDRLFLVKSSRRTEQNQTKTNLIRHYLQPFKENSAAMSSPWERGTRETHFWFAFPPSRIGTLNSFS